MKNILDKTFKINFASKAKIKSEGMKKAFNASIITNRNAYWTTSGNLETASMEFDLPRKKTFNVAMLQEEISVGQRIEKFHLEYWTGRIWKTFAGGTTVGYKRLLRFEPVRTNRVRLVIEKSRLNPTLNNFGLFRMAK